MSRIMEGAQPCQLSLNFSLGATLGKWTIIGVSGCIVFFVTTSTLVMDAVSDGMSRLLSIQTPYAKSKATAATQRHKIKRTKLAVRRNSNG